MDQLRLASEVGGATGLTNSGGSAYLCLHKCARAHCTTFLFLLLLLCIVMLFGAMGGQL